MFLVLSGLVLLENYYRLSIYRGHIWYESAHSTAITMIKPRSHLHSRTKPHTPPLRARRATDVFGELWPRYIESALYNEYIVFNSLDMHDLVMFSDIYELCTQLLFCVYYGRVIIAPSYIFLYIYICRIGTGLSWLCHVCHMRMRDLAKGNSKCVGRVNRPASSLIRVRQNDIHERPVLILIITHHPEFW